MKFLELGLLKKFGIINPDVKFLVVGTIKSKFSSNEEFKGFLEKSIVIVATASILSRLDISGINELQNQISYILLMTHITLRQIHGISLENNC